jgi:hypothetical protein
LLILFFVCFDVICSHSLQGLLEGVSNAFTKNFHFIDSVKAYLSYALLRASVSSFPVVFQVKIEIYSVLVFIILGVTVLIISVVRVSYYAKLMFLLLLQYACGIFSVLLLRFRESLKVKLLLSGLVYGNIVCCVVLLLLPLHSLNFSNIGAGGNWCLLSSDSFKVFG